MPRPVPAPSPVPGAPPPRARVESTGLANAPGGSTRSGVARTNKSFLRKKGAVGNVALLNKTCVTGAQVLASRGLRHVDWLSLDAEGHELEILRGVDFGAVQVDVVSVSTAKGRVFLTFLSNLL